MDERNRSPTGSQVMKPQSFLYTVLTVLAGLLFSSCGGGSGGATNTFDDSGGAVTSDRIITIGTISRFGSLIVNGVQFDTSLASVIIDGQPGTLSDLSVGQIVLIKGVSEDSAATVTADSIVFDDNVEGPIASIDPLSDSFVVLGQTILVDANTSFDGTLEWVEGITEDFFEGNIGSVGDFVQVSGLVTADGTIHATRITDTLPGGEFEVTGTVSNPNAQMFVINNLTVDFSAAMLLDFPGGSISDGDLVEAVGTVLGAGGELVATIVEFKGGESIGVAGDDVEIEGYITRFNTAADFDVSQFRVMSDSSTVFEGGVAEDLGVNTKVEVEGELDAAGVLVATKISNRHTPPVWISALVRSVSTDDESLALMEIATRAPIPRILTVNTDLLTRLEDKSNQALEQFAVIDIDVGDFVEVRGHEIPIGSRTVLASNLERINCLSSPFTCNQRVAVQGFVEWVSRSPPAYQILRLEIDTDWTIFSEDEGVLLDEAGDRISHTEFFERVRVGSLVRVWGGYQGDNEILGFQNQIISE